MSVDSRRSSWRGAAVLQRSEPVRCRRRGRQRVECLYGQDNSLGFYTLARLRHPRLDGR